MKRKFLMCSPCYYRVEYNFSDDNEYYNLYKNKQVNLSKACSQWFELYLNYISLNINVDIIPSYENLPELTFVGDSVFLFKDKAIISNFKHSQRQKEAEYVKKWMLEHHFEIFQTPPHLVFEGNAEAIYSYSKNLIVMGYGKRTTLETADFLRKILGIKVIPVRTYKFHLDICLFLIEDIIIYAEDSIDRYSLEELKSEGFKLIALKENLAFDFGLNNIYYEDKVFINKSSSSDEIANIFYHLGYKPIVLDLSEFHLVGGGIKCLTLEHYL